MNQLHGMMLMIMIGLVTVAGCAQKAVTLQERPTTLETGVDLQGTVVDDEQWPVAGASVAVVGGDTAIDLSVVSGKAGDFRFPVEPGRYRILVVAAGFENASQNVDVGADGAKVTIILKDLPSTEARVLVIPRAGHLQCAQALILFPASCDRLLMAPVFGDQNAFLVEIPAGHRLIVAETEWAARDTSLDVLYNINRTIALRSGVGLPVLRVELLPGEQYMAQSPLAVVGPVPKSEASFGLGILVNYAGRYQKEIDGAAGQVCRTAFSFHCAGLGVTTDIRFSEWISVFLDGVPADPASYSALPKP